MVFLQRLFSKESLYIHDKEFSDDKSRFQLPFNKAFLTIALVEDKTVQESLDNLDKCISNKYNLYNGLSYYSENNITRKPSKVAFSTEDDIIPINTTTTITEEVETDSATPSPSDFKGNGHAQFFDNFVSSDSSMDTMTSGSEADVEDTSSPEILKVKHIHRKKPTVDHIVVNRLDLDKDPIRKPMPPPLKLNYTSLSENINNESQLTSINHTNQYPLKGILRNHIPTLSPASAPVGQRRHTHLGNFRDIKSVSHIETIKKNRSLRTSAPPRVSISQLRQSIKANKKFLNSLKAGDPTNRDLIRLLTQQADVLNLMLKRQVVSDAVFFGGTFVFLIATCFSLSCCYRIRCRMSS